MNRHPAVSMRHPAAFFGKSGKTPLLRTEVMNLGGNDGNFSSKSSTMFGRFSLFPAIVFLLGSAAGWTQERGAMPTLNSAIQGQWVQFNLIGGQINLENSRVGSIHTGPTFSSRKDQLNINADNGETTMTYEWLNSKEHFTIDAVGTRLQVRRVPKNDAPGTAVEFTQQPQKKSVLTIGTEGNQQAFAGDSLWHLFILYPEAARKYLPPLVQPLQPNWKLVETADALEKSLLRDAALLHSSDRASWRRWVAQLGDENFARRQAADRALRTANPALLVYLQQLDFSGLDAEQQFRIRRIMEVISTKINNDSPEQVASWLAGDPAIWLAFLTRADVSTRRTAAKQLAAILESPIGVDAEADPASQKAALEQLRARIEAMSESEKK